MKKWICFCLKSKKRIKGFLSLALFTGIICCVLVNVLQISPYKKFGFRFSGVTPVVGMDTRSITLSESTGSGQSHENQKLSYERMKGGDAMYCTCFGLLNVRSAPAEDAQLVGQIAYGDQVQVFWKEDSGYVRILYRKPHSDEYVEGYCIRDELAETAPSDSRIYLAIQDFKQFDERWGSIPLGESYETIASAGCTTTCLAMAYSYLEGTVSTPDMMEERLHYNDDGLLGFPKVYTKSSDPGYLTEAYDKLKQKIPVLVGGKRDNGSPHWVLIVGYCGDGVNMRTEDFIINDPASSERHTLAEFFAEFPNFNKIAYYSGA